MQREKERQDGVVTVLCTCVRGQAGKGEAGGVCGGAGERREEEEREESKKSAPTSLSFAFNEPLLSSPQKRCAFGCARETKNKSGNGEQKKNDKRNRLIYKKPGQPRFLLH